MKICVIGTGYVGLVTGTCFAESGNDVICVDSVLKKIDLLNEGKIPFYEPGLEELVHRNVNEGRLRFSTNLDEAVKESLIIFISVGTPELDGGVPDLRAVFEVAGSIGRAINGYKIIIHKSTVPVGTAEKVRKIIAKETKTEFDIVSNPEFLKEGSALEDFMKPDRVVIGIDNVRVAEIMRALYAPFVRTDKPILIMDIKSAEMTKYVANAILAARISFMNEMANLCELVGADVDCIRKGIGSDSRIGHAFLFPGVGYGGSCFPKDMRALIHTGTEVGYELKIMKAVENVNNLQRQAFVDKIFQHFSGDVRNRKIALWGLAFKPRTDDMREAPSITVIDALLDKGANISAYDPEAMLQARTIFDKKIEFANSNYNALKNAEALVVVTEWNEFRQPNFDKIKDLMKTPVIFDGRNIYDPKTMREKGFVYYCMGRRTII
ncbi:MAG TPA: UDP-glucose dehydrogenase family protein [Candidatus Brocadiia bacterium]|nr:UDP-glucose/GDP-mannose dehydrogenase family protein [Planctomycetota bacterium]MDO8093776.1 UDP-glucose/GDP-mannose dehydrogenase family protein [Candidatus Brocadiales bacterium]